MADHPGTYRTKELAPRGPALAARAVAGGVLMGLANLVPGISGGTMLLAAGVYRPFVNGVAELSTFRFRPRSALTLACIGGGAAVAIFALAGPVSGLVIHHRWLMYSLFIGLTLGGVPVLLALVRPVDAVVVAAAVAGIAVMAAMAAAGPTAGGAGGSHSAPILFFAGLAGASAMVLPGISGGYLLLLLGQYVAILAAIAALREGLAGREWSAVSEAARTIVPVGIGVVVGIVGVSNLIKVLLDRFERATVGGLLGLLLGAVLGLWPFQHGVAPEPGSMLRGERVMATDGKLVLAGSGRSIKARDYPTEFFTPTALQGLLAAGLIGLGFAASAGITHLGRRNPETTQPT